MKNNAPINNEAASDACAGSAPLPAHDLQGEHDDDPANEPGIEMVNGIDLELRCNEVFEGMGYPIVVSHRFAPKSCPLCLLEGRNLLSLGPADEDRHVRDWHPEREVTYLCALCGREYKARHNCRCHVAKCFGPKPAVVDGQRCDICGSVFATVIGLSQHMRHSHPVAWNEARAAGTSHGRPPRRRHNQVFTEDEIRMMLECEVRYYGDKLMAFTMAPHIPTKTNTQLRHKRADQKYKQRRDQYLIAHNLPPLAAGPQDAQNLPESPARGRAAPDLGALEEEAAALVRDLESIQRDTREYIGWRNEIVESVLAQQLPQNAQRSQTAQTAIEQLGTGLRRTSYWEYDVPQGFIDTMYIWVLTVVQDGVRPKKPGPKRGARGGRGSRRRYLYAKTQDLYNKNPSLVARHVRTNVDWLDTPGIRCSNADVQDLYNNLWGHKPEVQVPDLGNSDPPKELSRVFSEITPEEIKLRFSQISRSTAAGPDGIRLIDVRKPAVYEVLHRFFNLIMVCARIPSE
ncbi:uncharacterized protein [Leptinotarsa decemlineata]|uniref:uncharacterized protein n=1 Tax=Leptinotarsa decemlineata TaxID=7539 RepID=UPI003D30848B